MSMLDGNARLIGVPRRADPFILEQDGEKIAYQSVSLAVIPAAIYRQLVTDITTNVTKNVVANVLAHLKDRCAFVKAKKFCNIARAAHHVNDHDFTEPPTVKPDAKD